MGIIDYHSPLNALISLKSHLLGRDAFAAVFESFEDIRHTFVEQPGDGAQTYASGQHRQLLENAIRWAADRGDESTLTD